MKETKDNTENFNETTGSKLRNILTPYITYTALQNAIFLQDTNIVNKKTDKLLESIKETCIDELDTLKDLNDKIVNHKELHTEVQRYITLFMMIKLVDDGAIVREKNILGAIQLLEDSCRPSLIKKLVLEVI